MSPAILSNHRIIKTTTSTAAIVPTTPGSMGIKYAKIIHATIAMTTACMMVGVFMAELYNFKRI